MIGAHVRLKEVNFRYEADQAHNQQLCDLALDLSPGSTTLLCGASGSGKSTALRLLNGLIPHFHPGYLGGEVQLDSVSIPDTPLWQLNMSCATVFQNPRSQCFTAEVASELAFGLERRGLPPEQIRERCLAAADALDLTERLGDHTATLSGGQLQRVACAAVIAAAPRLVLLDEPTANLDAAGVELMRAAIARWRDEGRTIVIAEHRVAYLRGLVDQVLVLADGRVARCFAGDDFYSLSTETARELGLRRLHPPMNSAFPSRPEASAADTSGLRLQAVRVLRGRRTVLEVDDMSFPSGQVHVIRGPNGVGKTTLARTICGLQRMSRGSIQLAGRTLSARQRRRQSTLVMQDVRRQVFAASALEEVQSSAPRGDADLARRRLADLDLGHLADQHPQSLSGGQMQRLVIACALAQQKQIYLFDEPTSGVDQRHLVAIAGLLRRLAEDGRTVLVITHDDELLDACADTVTTLASPDPRRPSQKGAVA